MKTILSLCLFFSAPMWMAAQDVSFCATLFGPADRIISNATVTVFSKKLSQIITFYGNNHGNICLGGLSENDTLLISGPGYLRHMYPVKKSEIVELQLEPDFYRLSKRNDEMAFLIPYDTSLRSVVIRSQKSYEKPLPDTYVAPINSGSEFIKVEISPSCRMSGTKMEKALSVGLQARKKIKRSGVLGFNFIIGKNGQINELKITDSFDPDIDRQVCENLKKISGCLPIIQNGLQFPVWCYMRCKISVYKKRVLLEIN